MEGERRCTTQVESTSLGAGGRAAEDVRVEAWREGDMVFRFRVMYERDESDMREKVFTFQIYSCAAW